MITAARARALLNYDAETGLLTWRLPAGSWKRIPAGRRAGAKLKGVNYGRVDLDGHKYLTHRVIWLWVYGEWPNGEIDHINGSRQDNRLANLRTATASQNKANARRRRDNTSGYKGVSFHKSQKQWRARTHLGGKETHLGFFNTREEAHAAYCRAAWETFGEFAREG